MFEKGLLISVSLARASLFFKNFRLRFFQVNAAHFLGDIIWCIYFAPPASRSQTVIAKSEFFIADIGDIAAGGQHERCIRFAEDSHRTDIVYLLVVFRKQKTIYSGARCRARFILFNKGMMSGLC